MLHVTMRAALHLDIFNSLQLTFFDRLQRQIPTPAGRSSTQMTDPRCALNPTPKRFF